MSYRYRLQFELQIHFSTMARTIAEVRKQVLTNMLSQERERERVPLASASSQIHKISMHPYRYNSCRYISRTEKLDAKDTRETENHEKLKKKNMCSSERYRYVYSCKRYRYIYCWERYRYRATATLILIVCRIYRQRQGQGQGQGEAVLEALAFPISFLLWAWQADSQRDANLSHIELTQKSTKIKIDTQNYFTLPDKCVCERVCV